MQHICTHCAKATTLPEGHTLRVCAHCGARQPLTASPAATTPASAPPPAPRSINGRRWLAAAGIALVIALLYQISAPSFQRYRAASTPTQPEPPPSPDAGWRAKMRTINELASAMQPALDRLGTAQPHEMTGIAASLQSSIDELSALTVPACLLIAKRATLQFMQTTHSGVELAATSPEGINAPAVVRMFNKAAFETAIAREVIKAHHCE